MKAAYRHWTRISKKQADIWCHFCRFPCPRLPLQAVHHSRGVSPRTQHTCSMHPKPGYTNGNNSQCACATTHSAKIFSGLIYGNTYRKVCTSKYKATMSLLPDELRFFKYVMKPHCSSEDDAFKNLSIWRNIKYRHLNVQDQNFVRNRKYYYGVEM